MLADASSAPAELPAFGIHLGRGAARVKRNGNMPLGIRVSEPEMPAVQTPVRSMLLVHDGLASVVDQAVEFRDPASGTLLWKRHRLPAAGELVGDDEFLCIYPRDGKQATVLATADGRLVRQCALPPEQVRVAVCGRRFVAIASPPAPVHTARPLTRPVGLTERLLNANVWLVYVFFYAPILVLVIFSFNSGRFVSQWEGFSLRWYATLWADDAIVLALRNSLIVAGVSTVVSTVVATMVAIGLERYNFTGKRALDSVLYLPIIIPDIAMAVMLLLFFVQAGQVLGLIGWRFSLGLGTVILAHVAFNISFVTVTVRARLADFDRALEEAAQDLYADEWQTLRHVTLPLIMPGILAGALLAFTMSLDDFVVTFFTSGPGSTTLPLRIYSMVKTGITPEINALSTLMLGASMVLVLVSLLLQRRPS